MSQVTLSTVKDGRVKKVIVERSRDEESAHMGAYEVELADEWWHELLGVYPDLAAATKAAFEELNR